MGIGIGLFLIAAGAILAFAVTATVGGVTLTTAGVILMVVGAVGVLLDLLLFMPRRRQTVTRSDTYTAPGLPTTRRATVEEERY